MRVFVNVSAWTCNLARLGLLIGVVAISFGCDYDEVQQLEPATVSVIESDIPAELVHSEFLDDRSGMTFSRISVGTNSFVYPNKIYKKSSTLQVKLIEQDIEVWVSVSPNARGLLHAHRWNNLRDRPEAFSTSFGKYGVQVRHGGLGSALKDAEFWTRGSAGHNLPKLVLSYISGGVAKHQLRARFAHEVLGRVELRFFLPQLDESTLDLALELADKYIAKFLGRRPWYEWIEKDLEKDGAIWKNLIHEKANLKVPPTAKILKSASHPQVTSEISGEDFNAEVTFLVEDFVGGKLPPFSPLKSVQVIGDRSGVRAYRSKNSEGKLGTTTLYLGEIENLRWINSIRLSCVNFRLDDRSSAGETCSGKLLLPDSLVLVRYRFRGSHKAALVAIDELITTALSKTTKEK